MKEAIAHLAIAAMTAGMAFLSLFFGFPLARFSIEPGERFWSAIAAAVLAGFFCVTGENLIESIVKSLIVALLTGAFWIARPGLSFIFVGAIVACTWGTLGSLASRALENRWRVPRRSLDGEATS
jgi:hypothetical protein